MTMTIIMERKKKLTCNIYAHNEHSNGARLLSEALGARRIRHNNSTYRGSQRKTVINWGSSTLPANIAPSRVINRPEDVRLVANKLSFFEVVGRTTRTPHWTTDIEVARSWQRPVMERHLLTSHSGQGIRYVQNPLDLGLAPLYTEYVPKISEWRIHFMDEDIIDIQRKIRNPDLQVTDWHVRNHDAGFIYVRQNLDVPDDVLAESENLLDNPLMPDFGAIDIIYNQGRDMAYVLEVNSAPGLTGETVNIYANAFRNVI